jgi:hypothetical protein
MRERTGWKNTIRSRAPKTLSGFIKNDTAVTALPLVLEKAFRKAMERANGSERNDWDHRIMIFLIRAPSLSSKCSSWGKMTFTQIFMDRDGFNRM